MARTRMSLISEEAQQEAILEQKIRTGELHADNFNQLSPEDQEKVNIILFKIASETINPNKGASVLEFVLFAYMRLMNKKMNGEYLNSEDVGIQDSLNRILAEHEITNTNIYRADWLFDYMDYAEYQAQEILKNRKEHIERKKSVTGQI
jgi:hypothetical protein